MPAYLLGDSHGVAISSRVRSLERVFDAVFEVDSFAGRPIGLMFSLQLDFLQQSIQARSEVPIRPTAKITTDYSTFTGCSARTCSRMLPGFPNLRSQAWDLNVGESASPSKRFTCLQRARRRAAATRRILSIKHEKGMEINRKRMYIMIMGT